MREADYLDKEKWQYVGKITKVNKAPEGADVGDILQDCEKAQTMLTAIQDIASSVLSETAKVPKLVQSFTSLSEYSVEVSHPYHLRVLKLKLDGAVQFNEWFC